MLDSDADEFEGVSPTTYLVPKMKEFAVSNTAFYKSMFITDIDPGAGKMKPLDGQIDAFADLPDSGAGTDRVAEGVLLTHEQGWFQEGLALGDLLHSLCLAPGEITKIAIIDWQRRVAAEQNEIVAQDETVQAQTDQELGAHEVQQSVARERQTGQSTTLGLATQNQAGGNVGFLIGGASASSSLSTRLGQSSSISTGARSLSAESSREISQRTGALSQATRSRRSTQIRETRESETQNVSTRVVANYNRMHALTVQYYEVLQVYQLKTRVVKAERVLYVPMMVMDFTAENIIKHRETLISIASDLGLNDLRERLLMLDDQEGLLRNLKATEERHADIVKQRDAALAEYNGLRSEMRFQLPFAEILPAIRKGVIDQDEAWHDRLVAAWGRLQGLKIAAEGTAAQVDALRTVVNVTLEALTEFLTRDRLVMNQLMWMRLDAYRVFRLVAPYSFEDVSLAALIDPKPLGVFGNRVAFRCHFNEPRDERRFSRRFEQDVNDAVIERVVLPSSGVFAEAVLGQSNAAEKIDVTRFWDWASSPIPILPPEFQKVGTDSRARDVDLAGGRLDPSLAALPSMQAMPESSLAALISGMQSGTMFRDMSGLVAASAAAAGAGEAAASGASDATEKALGAQKAYGDALVGLANSEAGKAAMQLAMTSVPPAKAATVLGGLMNSVGGKKSG